MAKNGADFDLPDEILSVIPRDPFDQLDLARRITSMAIASRVSELEAETGSLRKKIVDKGQVNTELQERICELNSLFQESDSKLRLAREENLRLAKERDTLISTTKKLSRDLTKLEAFKRQLMLSLNDDSPAQGGDAGNSELSVARISAWKAEAQSSFSRTSSDTGSSKIEEPREDATKNYGNKFSVTPYITPHLSPNATPKVLSTGGSPRGFATADSSPKFPSGATSPTNSHFEDQRPKSPWYPYQQTSAARSPPRVHALQGRTTQMDGKEFFRQARTRLSYEQFGSFLANIKELNAHRKSRQETLLMAEEIFGTENKDLFLSFQRLLNRN